MQPIAIDPLEQRSCTIPDSVGVFNLLTDDRFFDTVEEHLPCHRERRYPPTQTLAMFVSQVLSDDRSCQRAVDEHIARCLAHGIRPPSSSTSAFCEARQRLPLELVTQLAMQVALCAREICSTTADEEQPVLLIDGTSISMPDTESNQEAFPQTNSQALGCGFPQARMVATVCAITGVVVDAHLGACKGKGSDELTAMRALLEKADSGSIFVGDALYESYFTWVALAQTDCQSVFEINGSRALPRKVPRRVCIERSERPKWMTSEMYSATPKTVDLRVVTVPRKHHHVTYLITSLLDEERWPDSAIRKLYARRWDIEVDFRSIKEALGGGILSCKSPEMIEKELWIHLLGYNIIRLLGCEAAAMVRCAPREISFRHTQQMWSAWILFGVPTDEHSWKTLLKRIAQKRVRSRPDRCEPRAVKRRPKPRALLTQPRQVARAACQRP